MRVHWFVLPLLLAGSCGLASACSVPVFRYALERWHSAPYRVTLLHREPLGEAEAARLAELRRFAEATPNAFELRTLDIASAGDDADRALISAAEKTDLPSLVVQYPLQFGQDDPLWTIPWDADAVAKLVDSPLRSELAKRLAAGQTAVWLVVPCGDVQKDEAVIATLTQELKRLEAELELPELSEEDLQAAPFAGPPLRIEFSVLPIAREGVDDALVAMLLHSESDLAEFTEPLVYPVFGRGRALFPLVGAGITPPNIAEYTEFLVGACSCQVKEQNPGFDLLLTTDWDRVLQETGEKAETVETVETPVSQTSSEPQLVPIPRGATKPQPTVTSRVIVTPAASSSTTEETATSKPIASATSVIPWLTGVAAVVLVVTIVVWRRRTVARVRPN